MKDNCVFNTLVTRTMRPLKKTKYLSAVFVFFNLFLGCDIDHGLGVMESKIAGDIVFINPDKKPDYVESVRVVAAVKFPFTSLSDVVIMNTSVNLSKAQPNYVIPAPLSSYQVVAAVWKEKGKAWNYANLLGIYGFNPVEGQFDYKEVTLTKSNPVANNINIYCDWSLLRP